MIALVIANIFIWNKVWATYKHDRSTGPYPENPLFDLDLDRLWDAPTKPPKHFINEDKDQEKQLIRDFEQWLETQPRRDLDLEEYLWREGILNPEEAIWCEGVPLEAGNKQDYNTFLKIKDKALLEGMYNSKNLEDGGLEDLYISWFMLKGCGDYGAKKLIGMNIKPWEFTDFM